MIDFYHTELVEKIDVALACATILSAFLITSYLFFIRISSGRKQHKLDRLTKNLGELTLAENKFMLDECVNLVRKASPFELFNISRQNNSLLRTKFSDEFTICLTRAGKIEYAEKTASQCPNKWQRIEAIIIAASLHTPHILSILEQTVNDRDEDIAYFSMLALGEIQSADSVKLLVDLIRQRRFSGQKVAAVLEKFPPQIIPALIEHTADNNAQVRYWMLKVLTRFKPEGYTEQVLPFADDASDDIRAAACEFLGETTATQAVSVLTAKLDDRAWFVRLHAIRALEKITAADSLKHVFDVLDDKSWTIRNEAKNIAIKHITGSLPFIETLLKAGNDMQRHLCLEILDLSGYTRQIITRLGQGENARKEKDEVLFRSMVISGAFSGIVAAVKTMSDPEKDRIIDIVETIDQSKAQKIAQKLNEYAGAV